MLKISIRFSNYNFFMCAQGANYLLSFCVNRYSWWNKSCDLRFTQLSIEAHSRTSGKLYYSCDFMKDWFFIIILRVIIYVFRNF